MEVRLGSAARDRRFSRAMRRIRPGLQQVLNALWAVELQHPVFDAILIGVTDEHARGWYEEVPNSDGFFQVMAGCAPYTTDESLIDDVFQIIRSALILCPLAVPDRQALLEILDRNTPDTKRSN